MAKRFINDIIVPAVNGTKVTSASGEVSSVTSVSSSNFARITVPLTTYGRSGGTFTITITSADQHYSATGVFNRRSSGGAIVARLQNATGNNNWIGTVSLSVSGNDIRFNYAASSGNSSKPYATILVQSIDPNVSVSF